MYCMEEGVQEDSSPISLHDLPPELFERILDGLTADVTAPRHVLFFSGQENALKNALKNLYCIRRILPFSGVCRRFYGISRVRISKYFFEVERSINEIGGADAILSKAVRNGDTDIARLCLMIGADIDAAKYTANNIIVPEYRGKETLLTEAIKKFVSDMVNLLLGLGADPMQPNAQGEFPIDIAHKKGFYHMAAVLKENGGDPSNHYYYYCSDKVSSVSRYSLRDYEPQPKPSNPFMVEKPIMGDEPQELSGANHESACTDNNETKKSAAAFLPRCRIGVVFSAGILVGISYWTYKKWQQRKRAKQKRRQQELRDGYRLVYR